MPSGCTIDGHDMTEYGVKVIKSTGPFNFLKRKGESSYSWPDADGEEAFTDADDIYFEGRDFYLYCLLIADTKAAFLTQWNALCQRLQMTGLRTLVVPYSAYSYELMYVEGSDPFFYTKWNSDKIMAKFHLKFRETTPRRSYT